MDEACEVDCAAIIACCESTEVFEAIEASLDAVAVLVDVGVVRDGDLAVALGRDHRLGLHVGDLMTETTSELQTINTAWQIAIQEILRMVVRDIYRTGDETVFKLHIKRIEEAAVDSIYTGLMLRGTDEWTELLVKEKASNFVTTLLTSFTFDRV